MELFKIEDLTFSYPNAKFPALESINLMVRDGEFLLLCGKSGCGKSTLLRHFKSVLTPHGEKTGEIYYKEKPLNLVDQRTQASEIGFVMQSPEHQIVTDKVWHELAFGLESLGCDTETIRLRVAEMASFFGIQTWFMKNVSELSGGQKQLLNLAAVMAMQPSVLILDEPTSQLDPIAASDFLDTVKKINSELGTTVILSEHRLEEVYEVADRVAVMDHGEIITVKSPCECGTELYKLHHDMFKAMPAPVRIFSQLESKKECPLTIKEGRIFLNQIFEGREVKIKSVEHQNTRDFSNSLSAIDVKDIWFRYERELPDVLTGVNLNIKQGQFFCIVGGNGTGKSTMLSIIAGLNRPYRGKVKLFGKDIKSYKNTEFYQRNIGVLPQDPQALFVEKTVELDLTEMLDGEKLTKAEKSKRVREIAHLVEIEPLLSMHPYDISGGEQQRAALAKILLKNPKILLLDEPTKGMDSHFKKKFAGILRKLQDFGTTIVMVSHDIEFCALYADFCALFFNGNVVSENIPERFFAGNRFYTTGANRISRHLFENAITVEDVINLCQKNL